MKIVKPINAINAMNRMLKMEHKNTIVPFGMDAQSRGFAIAVNGKLSTLTIFSSNCVNHNGHDEHAHDWR